MSCLVQKKRGEEGRGRRRKKGNEGNRKEPKGNEREGVFAETSMSNHTLNKSGSFLCKTLSERNSLESSLISV